MTKEEAHNVADVALGSLPVAASHQLRVALGDLLEIAEAGIASGTIKRTAELSLTINRARAFLDC